MSRNVNTNELNADSDVSANSDKNDFIKTAAYLIDELSELHARVSYLESLLNQVSPADGPLEPESEDPTPSA